MERKTKITAEEGKHDLLITREFDLPVELLFRAHVEPDIFEQWMSHDYGTTKVKKLEARAHGGWLFQTSDLQGNVVFQANGVFHDFEPNKKITRTFEMNNTPFPVQLEFLDFSELTEDTSKLTIHVIYKSIELRDQMLKMPFSQGMNMAHNRLQEIVHKLK
ncbi:SRPBCC domain-containing protein [Pseudochryseolinea flava]|uniref:ATPase n=1 Tax=Pseudochryseolinea flava TaxID=2059302 RepID=A0A364Y5F7_9BACT|nr:SRPBCC domain-containing protein [Pseudochryseolinea flava]RAW02226.1 ATPase [Pseudochryseolinea flava]